MAPSILKRHLLGASHDKESRLGELLALKKPSKAPKFIGVSVPASHPAQPYPTTIAMATFLCTSEFQKLSQKYSLIDRFEAS